MKNIYKKRYFISASTLFIILCLLLTLISCQAAGNFIKEFSDKTGLKDFFKGAARDRGSEAPAAVAVEEEGEEKDITETPPEKLPIKIWLDDTIPPHISTAIMQHVWIACPGAEEADKDEAQIKVELLASDGNLNSEPDIRWILVPVSSFFTVCDEISWDDFLKFWNSDSESLNYISGGETEISLALTSEVFNALKKMLGEPAGSAGINIVEKNELMQLLWENDGYFSIIPFEDVEIKYKVLKIDGNSIFDKELNIADYPLSPGIYLSGEDENVLSELKKNLKNTLIINMDPDKLVTVNMTGVTAMARQIRKRIDSYGVLSPGEEIAETLSNADITHISNEIPFVEGCTGAREKDIVFCSRPDFIELLKYVGTDVIELTGNHMNDYGNEWMHYTLDIYDEEGWPYFGGGRNIEECYRAATFEIDGSRIAFLGANTFGPDWNWATEDTPGSARINMWDEAQKEEDMQKFEELIKDLKRQGYTVIFTFQYEETYNYYPTEAQKEDFRRIIDAGADIVSGSQSHHPMGVEFRGRGFINYGLGNLFFGQQLQILGNNPGIIAKHVFYEGKHINTVLITTMLNDFSQPRLTTPEEREGLLKSIFKGSIIEDLKEQ